MSTEQTNNKHGPVISDSTAHAEHTEKRGSTSGAIQVPPPSESSLAPATGGAHQDSVSSDHDRKLHPFTLWLPALDSLIRSIVPMAIGSLFVGPIAVVTFFVAFILIPMIVYHILRYYTISYRVAADELTIRSGLLARRERRIPFDRVQEVEINQGFLHRILRCAKVDISTAGKDTQEAALNVLTIAAAEQLKQAVSTKQRAPVPAVESHDTDDAKQPADAFNFEFKLDLKTLILGGLSSKVVATIGAVIGAIAYFQFFVGMGGDWVRQFSEGVEKNVKERSPLAVMFERWEPDLPDTGVLGFAVGLWTNETLPKSILLAVLGLGFTVAAYVLRYYSFRLARADDLLSTSHGLLTYRQGTLSRDRIQALKLEESLLRRWFGMAAVRVDSAGDNTQVDENKNRDVLVPGARLADAEEVARQAIPGLVDLTPPWNRVSPHAVMRGCKKGWLLTLLVMLMTIPAGVWYGLMWLPVFPLVYLLNYKWYRHMGYWVSDDYLLVRRGWMNRSTFCIPIRNIQSVGFHQTPFDRRLDLASLSIDIAGQSNTGGGPRVRHLAVHSARTLQSQLANRAAECEFKW